MVEFAKNGTGTMDETANVKRIAMWSGPQNISTALMRSWGNRSDCYVSDAPLYAYYLQQTGADDLGRDETLAAHDADWRRVVGWLTGCVPRGRAIWYQKHLAHHMLPEVGRAWMSEMTHAFLIRDPGELLLALRKSTPGIEIGDTGLPQQVALFEWLTAVQGVNPIVIDARDVLERPEAMLRQMCLRLQVPFEETMLNWPPGGRETDGAWARHQYAKIEATTRFGKYRPKLASIPVSLSKVHDQCLDFYDQLSAHSLQLN